MQDVRACVIIWHCLMCHIWSAVWLLVLLSGDDYGPAPDLDHANPDLRAALKDWLLWLQHDIGFGAWRLDFVKG